MKRLDTTAVKQKLVQVEAKLKGLIKEVLGENITITGEGIHNILAVDSSYSTSDPVLEINMLVPSVTIYHPGYEISGKKVAGEFEKSVKSELTFETDYTKYLSTQNNSP